MGGSTEGYDPAGGPEPVGRATAWLESLGTFATVAAIGYGIYLVAAPALVRPTCGATRSAQLQWQERQELIEEQIRAERTGQDDTPSQD